MRNPIILKLDPSKDFDLSKFFVEYSNGRLVDLKGCSVSHIYSPQLFFKYMFVVELIEHGLSTYLSSNIILEDITTPRTPPDHVEAILVKFLTKICIDDELIIIDPYFFSPAIDVSYPARVCNIIKPFLRQIRTIKIVTASHSRAFSCKSKDIVLNSLYSASNSLNISHTQSNELHDRFWISNKRRKGIISGTSLNGLGKKYAVIDYLDDDDVKTIVSDFYLQHLI